MRFSEFSIYLQQLERTTSRNTMIEILAELFHKADTSEIDRMVYLLQGRVAPLYVHLEMGMADKMMVKAIAFAYQVEEKEAIKTFKRVGDVGVAAEEIAREKHIKETHLRVNEVFEVLEKVAKTGGSGSVETKVKHISDLLNDLDPLSSRYVTRIPVGRLRLGFSDMSLLDSFSWMLAKSKLHRPEIERAYNVRPDLGFIGRTIKEKGLKGLQYVEPAVCTPIMMARAERLSSAKAILEKIGTCSIEPKVDGFRLQAHYKKRKAQSAKLKAAEQEVTLFTRNLEDVTYMYPDVVEGIKKQIDADGVIFEGEAIAYDTNTGEFLPFQETVQRKRKYQIEEKAKEIPLKMICFDLLYLNGENFIKKSYRERRHALEQIVKKGDVLLVSEEKVTKDEKEIDLQFDNAVSRGLEGIMAKRLEGVYQAGARGWNWIKYKRSYSGSLEDTIDAVVMGYYVGRGKRTIFGIGAFLIGIYDKKRDVFVTVAKIGTGLTDEEWRGLYKRCNGLRAKEKPPLIKSVGW